MRTGRHGHVLTVTIDRPEARNAVDSSVWLGLGLALEAAEADADVRAVVVTGAGPVFCAGADLKAMARGESLVPDHPGAAAWGFAGYVEHRIGVPTIAAVNGPALGGGTEICLASDLVIASETASFGLPEVTRGLIAAGGGVVRLGRQIPSRVALEMLLTGEPVDARRALALGLVNAVVPPAGLMAAAHRLAARIAANAPLAVRAAKRVSAVADEHEAWAVSRGELAGLMGSDDVREGLAAFTEKRPPVWRGR